MNHQIAQSACRREHRRGATVIFFALTLIIMVAIVAFAVDIGYLCLVRTQLQAAAGERAEFEIIASTSTVGGGAMPLAELPGFAIAVTPHRLSLQQLADRLRCGDPPVITRVQDQRLLLDPRTLLPGEEELLVAALGEALAN